MMKRFQYQSRDGKGERVTGVISAATVEEAGRLLRQEGKFILKLSEVVEGATRHRPMSVHQHARRCKRQDVIFFMHQMAVMIQTGVPLSEALACAAEQAPNPAFREVLNHITQHVESGGTFSAALAKFPRVFPEIVLGLVRASEASGTMGEMLERISDYLTKESRIVKQVRGALTYPVIMVGFAISVTLFLLIFVLPQFEAIYVNRGATLPMPTRILMGASNAVLGYWYFWLMGLGAAVAGLVLTMQSEKGRRAFDWLKLNTPVLRNLFTQLYVTRSCATLGTMITAGVSVLDAVEIVRGLTNNAYYRDMWDSVDEALRQGSQLSDPLFRAGLMPRSVSQMIRSGERSGRLGKVLDKVAEFSQVELDEAIKQTTQFIEPAMIGFMGGLIGFVAIALLLPIFSVGQVMAQ